MVGKKDLKALEEQLNKTMSWPSVYMFKFIIPDKMQLHQQMKGLFSEHSSVSTRVSRNGRFVSYTVKEVMLSTENVLAVYQRAMQIDELIAL